MRARWGEAKMRHLLKSPQPQMPASNLPPFGKWELKGGAEMLHGIVVAVHAGGVEVYDLAGNNACKSLCAKVCARGVAIALRTCPPHCNQKNWLYIAVGLVPWLCNTPEQSGAKCPPPPLKKFATPGRECFGHN